jgi:hypothetical protein
MTEIRVNAGSNLQQILNDAAPGDNVILEAGATFEGNHILPPKSAPITLTSSRSAELATGVRVKPEQAGLMARLVTPNAAPALDVPPGARGLRAVGLELVNAPTTTDYSYSLVRLGDGDTAGPQKTLDSAPSGIEIDRCYLHPRDEQTHIQHGIILNSAQASVTNSHISGVKWPGVESHAVAGWNGPGPFTVENNYLEAAGINIIFGGARPAIPNLIPSDIHIRNNYLFNFSS